MNAAILEQREIYREVNAVTGRAGSVIFGEERFAGLPVAELVQDFGLNISVCNRSLEGAVLADAFEMLEECVFELHPRKLFLNFGEADLQCGDYEPAHFLAEYARLLEEIRGRCPSQIYLVSIPEKNAEARQLNGGLRDLAESCGCCYVDAADIFCYEKPHLRLFSVLMHCMREGRISFAEAMQAV